MAELIKMPRLSDTMEEGTVATWFKKVGDKINEGDILMFKNAGAYCFTMSSNYNSRFRPAEVLWHNNRAHTIRKQETLDDLISNQILIDFSEKVEIN